jgi:RNA polymerase sigma-70 factor, ECF subfamily
MPGDAAQLEKHRAFLIGHCYRMLGSAVDADDAVQETMVRAWKGLDRFDGRSSLRTWLYRIATHVCLDALSRRSSRVRPMDLGPAGTVEDELLGRAAEEWVEPIPDAWAVPSDADPAARTEARQRIGLAFVAALQHLPPRQRAVLLLSEVLGWSAAEVAESLDTTPAAVNSALQRARATLAGRDLAELRGPLSDEQASLVRRYVSAFERYDMDALTALLREDATMNMPPFTLWLRGHEAVRRWMLGRGAACRGSRLVPVEACGGPAFAQYKPHPEGGHRAWSLTVLELDRDRIAGMTFFLDTERLFPLFGLPLGHPAEASVGQAELR